MDYETDAIDREPAKDNPWLWLMKITKALDFGDDKPLGYHWFWALERLHLETEGLLLYNFFEIQRAVPDGHWLREISPLESHDKYISDGLKEIVKEFVKKFKNQEEIRTFDFTKLKFTFRTDFSNFIFPMEVFFEYSIFYNHTNFSNAIFLENVYCSNVKFHHNAIFLNADFCKAADFNKTTIIGQIDFTKAKFRETAPLFHNATLNPDVIWDSATWPKDTKNKAVIRNNQNAYETLAHLMEGLDKHYDQHLFFRRAMHCRRILERNPFIRCPYWLYEKISDYGYGFGRAFIGWLLHIVAGTVALFLHHFYTPKGAFFDDLICSAGISFANAHSFLFLHDGPLIRCQTSLKDLYLYNTIWGIQIVLGILFLFLLLLTLRIRFRLK